MKFSYHDNAEIRQNAWILETVSKLSPEEALVKARQLCETQRTTERRRRNRLKANLVVVENSDVLLAKWRSTWKADKARFNDIYREYCELYCETDEKLEVYENPTVYFVGEYLKGYTMLELAEKTGCTKQAIKYHIRKFVKFAQRRNLVSK